MAKTTIRATCGLVGYQEVTGRRERRRILSDYKKWCYLPTATIDNCSISKSPAGGAFVIYDPFWRLPVLAV